MPTVNKTFNLCPREKQLLAVIQQGESLEVYQKMQKLSQRTLNYYLKSVQLKCACGSLGELGELVKKQVAL